MYSHVNLSKGLRQFCFNTFICLHSHNVNDEVEKLCPHICSCLILFIAILLAKGVFLFLFHTFCSRSAPPHTTVCGRVLYKWGGRTYLWMMPSYHILLCCNELYWWWTVTPRVTLCPLLLFHHWAWPRASALQVEFAELVYLYMAYTLRASARVSHKKWDRAVDTKGKFGGIQKMTPKNPRDPYPRNFSNVKFWWFYYVLFIRY